MQVENECKVTEIFCIIDDFCKEFSKIESKKSISDGKSHRNKPNRQSDAEVILIIIMFHMGGFKCLKHYYVNYICVHCRQSASLYLFFVLRRLIADNPLICLFFALRRLTDDNPLLCALLRITSASCRHVSAIFY